MTKPDDNDKPPKPRKFLKRVPAASAHEAQKWLVLECVPEGVPECAKRRTVNVWALVQGRTTIEAERAKLEADVDEYYERWLALQDAIAKLEG